MIDAQARALAPRDRLHRAERDKWLMATFPIPGSTPATKTAIRLTDTSTVRVECRWCGWGDHNSTFHERVEQQAEGP